MKSSIIPKIKYCSSLWQVWSSLISLMNCGTENLHCKTVHCNQFGWRKKLSIQKHNISQLLKHFIFCLMWWVLTLNCHIFKWGINLPCWLRRVGQLCKYEHHCNWTTNNASDGIQFGCETETYLPFACLYWMSSLFLPNDSLTHFKIHKHLENYVRDKHTSVSSVSLITYHLLFVSF